MLAKMTSKNQITMPAAVAAHFQGVNLWIVSTDGNTVILRPFEENRGDEVRRRLAELRISERHVAQALAWANGTK